VIDADEEGDIDQSLCSEAGFGLSIQRLVDAVTD
jgi:hypothetical protein